MADFPCLFSCALADWVLVHLTAPFTPPNWQRSRSPEKAMQKSVKLRENEMEKQRVNVFAFIRWAHNMYHIVLIIFHIDENISNVNLFRSLWCMCDEFTVGTHFCSKKINKQKTNSHFKSTPMETSCFWPFPSRLLVIISEMCGQTTETNNSEFVFCCNQLETNFDCN